MLERGRMMTASVVHARAGSMTVVMAQGAKAATIVEYEVAREQSAGSTW
jgi:phosphotransferase system HPr-like phosphotransfer protein